MQRLIMIVITFILFNGCSQPVAAPLPHVDKKLPTITAHYLFEHRIVSHNPLLQTEYIATLPYEIRTFDESYRLYLVANFKTAHQSLKTTIKEPSYYLRVERNAKNWRDFTQVYSPSLTSLVLESHDSHIRQGQFYKNYTIALSKKQLLASRKRGFRVTLTNRHKDQSLLALPKTYVEAFLMMIDETEHTATREQE